MYPDTYRILINAGLIDEDTDLEGFDEPPAWIEGFDGYPDLLNDMREEDRCRDRDSSTER